MSPRSRRDPEGFVWWRDGVLYQIYPRSYRDSNGDGVGDLPGIIDKLDYLEWLGIDGIWLCPVHPSPNADWGYDVADYYGVDPSLGTVDDLERLIAGAASRGIRVMLDLVPNHTSDQHPWFVEARSSKDNPKRDWYVWADAGVDGTAPNNWVSLFTGPAWKWDDSTGQYFLHHFLEQQPDLNWWNEDVQREFDRIIRFWFDRGVSGFRIDVAHVVFKDRDLRDNPPATENDHWMDQYFGQIREHNSLLPEVHDTYRRWRAIADSYEPKRMFVGETHVFDYSALASFYGADDELNLAFNFIFMNQPFDAEALANAVDEAECSFRRDSWPVWMLGNHDNRRFVSRWCDDDPARVRLALLMLMALRGTPFLYYGDEIGMPDTVVEARSVKDPVGRRVPELGRDPERTPMPWTSEPDLGFSDGQSEPWLPYGDAAAANVAEQLGDHGSILHFTRGLIGLRRSSEDLRAGAYERVAAPDGSWRFRRGRSTEVLLNFSAEPRRFENVAGTVQISTNRERNGRDVGAVLELAPSEGVILHRSDSP